MESLSLTCAAAATPPLTLRASPRDFRVCKYHTCAQLNTRIARANRYIITCNYNSKPNKRHPTLLHGSINGAKSSTNAISIHSAGSESEPYSSGNLFRGIQKSVDAFYRFSRPHTIIGTTLSIISISLLAVGNVSDISPAFLAGLLEALVSSLLMNVYVVGLNQLFDVEIDKVNKPYLPLASGEYSMRTGVAIVSVCAILSFSVGITVGSLPLFLALLISFILGSAYSIDVPFLRWKRFAVLAAMCIMTVRAVIVQLAFFMHMQSFVFRRPAIFTKPVLFATAFMTIFSVVIALFKDIPDIDGDSLYGIRSFTVRLGQQRVFWICIGLLQMAYTVAAVVGFTSSCTWSKVVTVLSHGFLASLLWARAKSLDIKDQTKIKAFYMFIWKLFYAEYFLIPLVR